MLDEVATFIATLFNCQNDNPFAPHNIAQIQVYKAYWLCFIAHQPLTPPPVFQHRSINQWDTSVLQPYIEITNIKLYIAYSLL